MTAISAAKRPHFAKLIAACDEIPPLRTALVCPHQGTALEGAVASHKLNLIEPVLVGEPDRIRATAKRMGLDISPYEIVEAEGEEGAAHKAVDLAVADEVDILMKGYIHSDTYLSAVIRKNNGLRTNTRTSHCFVMDIPGYPRPVIITDAALNVAPSVDHRLAISQNAINLALSLGIEEPKVAILSATETPNKAIPSSMDAREIAEKAMAGAVSGGIVDGPLALDNAVSVEAAELKGIDSPVAGIADILVVPTVEAGNIFFKALTFLGGAETSGLVVGAAVPVILTSRADSTEARIASSALAALYGRWLETRETA